MIASFSDKTTRDIYDGINSKQARRLPKELHAKARRLLDQIEAALVLADLEVPPGNRLEALKGNLKGFHSIRINDQWRVIFKWKGAGVEDVQIIDYHKG